MAVLWNADDRAMTLRYREVEKAAQMLHVTVQALGVREPDDFDMAFSAMAPNRPDALFLVTDALTILNRKRVIDFAEKHRIPAMYESGFLVRDGGLMSYGADQDDNYRRAASYGDRIFKEPHRAPCPSSGRADTISPSISRPPRSSPDDPAGAPAAGRSGDRVAHRMPELIAALDAFMEEHRRCGELDGGVDDGRAWMAATVGLPRHILYRN
jgi:hypothetical protein